MSLARPQTQPEFRKGAEANRAGKPKDSNPWKNISRRGAEIRQIYWDMGWDWQEGQDAKMDSE